jgi:hypothetical protein
MKVLCDMVTRSGAILKFVRFLLCSKHNIGNEGCNREFNNCVFGV